MAVLYLIGASRLAPQFAEATIALAGLQKMLLVFLGHTLAAVLSAAVHPPVEGDRLGRLISSVAAAAFVLAVSPVAMFPLQVPLSGRGPVVYTAVAASIYALLIGVVAWLLGPLSSAS